MSTITRPPATPQAIEQRFRELEAIWLRDTAHLSSSTQIRNHPALQEIISLGEAVVPLMLRDLAGRPRLWVWALPTITDENPVAPADAGNIAKMTEAWLSWGKAKGYAW